jgi:nucleoid DNA-binding protein
LAALATALGLVLAFASPAFSDKAAPKGKEKESLKSKVAASSKLAEEDVAKVLDALGPAIRDKLAAGEVIELPGLGVFRVVRVPDHKDMVNGRPATIAGVNSVEFLPTGGLVDAANNANAVPAETVPAFQYNPLPGQAPGMRVPEDRMPNIRIR